MEKTQYFTKDNISLKTEYMLNIIEEKVQLHNDKLDMDNAALLILDMQRFFFNDSSHAFMPSGKAIIAGIIKTTKLFHDKNRPIIVTRHVNTNENAKMMDFWWRDILTANNKRSCLIDEIEDIPKSEVIIKTQYDAFFNTKLHQFLQKHKIEQIVITGVITHLCCETTARSAFVRGYNVFFPIDGTATYNQEIHLYSLNTLAHGFANITTIQKITETIIE